MRKIKEILPYTAAVLVFVAAAMVETSPAWAVALMCAAGIAGKAGNWGYEKGTHTMLGGSSEFPGNSQ